MQRARLLLIDDEERVLRSLAQAFRAEHEVWLTGNPDQALAWVQQQDFHVVLCDQRMPSLPGVELLRRIRQLSPHTVRLLLTGYADIPAIIASINEGEIWRFISKPWDPVVLAAAVAQAIELGQRARSTTSIVQRDRTVVHEPLPVLVFDEDPATAQELAHLGGESLKVQSMATLDRLVEGVSALPVPVLFSEVHLGGVDALMLLKGLRQAYPDLMLVTVSGMLDSQVLIQLVNQCEIFRFLSKPLVPQRVQEVLSAVRAHRLRQLVGRPTGRPAVAAPAGSSGFSAVLRRWRAEWNSSKR